MGCKWCLWQGLATATLIGAIFLLSPHRDSELMALLLFLFTQLEVEVVDMNGKTIDGPVRLDISVIDQNDNRPMFKEGPYVGHVMEGSATGESMPVPAQ